jgi:hypothetical protein
MAKSVGFYLGMGCLGLVVLGFGGCALIGFKGLGAFNQTFNQPVDEATVLQELGGIPKYPGSTYNEMSTKLTRGVFKLISMADGDKKALGGVFNVTDAPEKVFAFYDDKMKEAGYKEIPLEKVGKLSKMDSVTHQYEKDKAYFQVTVRKSEEEGKTNSQELVLLRFEGFTPEEIAEIGNEDKSEKTEDKSGENKTK